MEVTHFDIMQNDDGIHSLLDPPSPAYSSDTIRRAFIVWVLCGQRNEFRHVCNFYHYLEAQEETLPPEKRTSSRCQEFKLLFQAPPTSNYLQRNFPQLYQTQNQVNVKKIQEIKLEDCVFNLEGFYKMKQQKGVTTSEIIRTSKLIRQYCITHMITLKKFLLHFQNFANKCQIANSVNNVAVYISKQNVKDEIDTWRYMPTHFSFLDEEVTTDELSKSNDKNVSVSSMITNLNKIK